MWTVEQGSLYRGRNTERDKKMGILSIFFYWTQACWINNQILVEGLASPTWPVLVFKLQLILHKRSFRECFCFILWTKMAFERRIAQGTYRFLSYPNFVRGLLFDDMQPLVSRFEILGILCCTKNEVPRRVRNQKEAGLRNPWNSIMWRKSKRGVFA